MVSKKKRFGDDEIPIFNDGCIYKLGNYWHFRLWLKAENKYARKSLVPTVQPVRVPTSQNLNDDAILDTAMNRWEQIGFQRGQADFKTCVMEQIRLLSNLK